MQKFSTLIFVVITAIVATTGCAAAVQAPAAPVTPVTDALQNVLPGDYTFTMSPTAKPIVQRGQDEGPIQYPIDPTRHGRLITLR